MLNKIKQWIKSNNDEYYSDKLKNIPGPFKVYYDSFFEKLTIRDKNGSQVQISSGLIEWCINGMREAILDE